ncbi:MAG: hypothetical protein AB8I08_40260 [Sandaracinaceae bacterium]
MMDYAFFAMLLAIATALAPSGSAQVGFQNTRHPDQHMTWVRGDDGRWAMTINGREAGHYHRSGDVVIQDRGDEGTERFRIGQLLNPNDLGPQSTHIRLAERFTHARLDIHRDNSSVELRETARRILVTGLRLESSP